MEAGRAGAADSTSGADASGSREKAAATPPTFIQSDLLHRQLRSQGSSSVRSDEVPSVESNVLCECMIQDSTSNNVSWYTRIPSPGNIADAPSRMKLDEVAELFQFELVEPILDYMDWGRIG